MHVRLIEVSKLTLRVNVIVDCLSLCDLSRVYLTSHPNDSWDGNLELD